MAWNPETEVAVARDAARELDAPMCVVLWVTRDGENLGVSSYGETLELCGHAKRLSDHVFDAALKWGGEE